MNVADFVDIPTKQMNDKISFEETVFDLLRYGRDSESNFDIKHSPFAAYLYAFIGDEGVDECLKYAVYPMDEENAKALLGCIPKIASNTIINACAKVATTRVELLNELIVDV